MLVVLVSLVWGFGGQSCSSFPASAVIYVARRSVSTKQQGFRIQVPELKFLSSSPFLEVIVRLHWPRGHFLKTSYLFEAVVSPYSSAYDYLWTSRWGISGATRGCRERVASEGSNGLPSQGFSLVLVGLIP